MSHLCIVALPVTMILYSVSAFACQESCQIIAASAKVALLEDGDGKPLAKAEVIIRDASEDADRAECLCGRFAPMINHVWTDERGHFYVGNINNGRHWIRYMNPQDGESFLVSIEKNEKPRRPLELQINHLAGGCYLVDVERNETQPNTGWPKPISQSHAEKN